MIDIIDKAMADALGVSLDVYIEKIESFTYVKSSEIIALLWSSSDSDLNKAKLLFNDDTSKR
tara:strand:- start:1217 stop:1402 length:186 start_codon:yes stop_codon:yes gene_type:complete